MSTETSIADEAVGDISSRQFVTFQVNGEVFAVAMAPVQEIIRVPQSGARAAGAYHLRRFG